MEKYHDQVMILCQDREIRVTFFKRSLKNECHIWSKVRVNNLAKNIKKQIKNLNSTKWNSVIGNLV